MRNSSAMHSSQTRTVLRQFCNSDDAKCQNSTPRHAKPPLSIFNKTGMHDCHGITWHALILRSLQGFLYPIYVIWDSSFLGLIICSSSKL